MRNSDGDWLGRILVLSHWKQWDLIRSLATASELKNTMAVSQRELGCVQATYTGSFTTEALQLRRNYRSGRPIKLNCFFTYLTQINQGKGVSKRPWWMTTRRSQRVPCGFDLFLTSHVTQSCQVTQIDWLRQWKSSLNHKGIIFVRFNIIVPSFLPKLCLWTQHPAPAQ